MILEHVVPWGRTLNEYQNMFALDKADLEKKILGCGDGPSSFNAQLTALGGQVTSLDPVYAFSKEQLSQRIQQTAQTIIEQVNKTKNDFVWNSITSVQHLKELRMAAMQDFLLDYDQGKTDKRYLEGALPDLPFETQHFDLVLCSHFLFLYSDHFDLSFHINAVKAMCDAGKEVRIFPLVDLKGKPSTYLQPLMQSLDKLGLECQIQKVAYEFQKGANEMLRITL